MNRNVVLWNNYVRALNVAKLIVIKYEFSGKLATIFPLMFSHQTEDITP